MTPETNLSSMKLLKPEQDNGLSVLQALKKRKTVRGISDKKLPVQVLSNLLWAACGINRKEGPFGIPGRTSASASNSQEIDVYVALEEGTYLYEPVKHVLIQVYSGDLRRLAIGKGQAGFGEKAAVRLIFIADLEKLINTRGYQEPGLTDPEIQKSYYFADTGMIASNVYMFAASSGLAAWFHNCDRTGIKSKLNLREEQRVVFGMTIGYEIK